MEDLKNINEVIYPHIDQLRKVRTSKKRMFDLITTLIWQMNILDLIKWEKSKTDLEQFLGIAEGKSSSKQREAGLLVSIYKRSDTGDRPSPEFQIKLAIHMWTPVGDTRRHFTTKIRSLIIGAERYDAWMRMNALFKKISEQVAKTEQGPQRTHKDFFPDSHRHH